MWAGSLPKPQQAVCTVEHDNLKSPPSRGGRIQSRMAPGMYHPSLSGRDTRLSPRVRGGGRGTERNRRAVSQKPILEFSFFIARPVKKKNMDTSAPVGFAKEAESDQRAMRACRLW